LGGIKEKHPEQSYRKGTRREAEHWRSRTPSATCEDIPTWKINLFLTL
jgi:hypothetical protein